MWRGIVEFCAKGTVSAMLAYVDVSFCELHELLRIRFNLSFNKARNIVFFRGELYSDAILVKHAKHGKYDNDIFGKQRDACIDVYRVKQL